MRRALIQRLLTLLPEEARAPLQNLQQHLDAPLEIALLQDKNELNLLIAATAQFADDQALQQTLAQTFPAPWQVGADRIEQRGEPPIAYRYDAANQRLLLSTGLVKNPADSLKYLSEDGGDAPFTALQSRLDPKADGLYLWLDPQNPLIQLKTRDWQPVLTRLGLDHSRQLALTWTTPRSTCRPPAAPPSSYPTTATSARSPPSPCPTTHKSKASHKAAANSNKSCNKPSASAPTTSPPSAPFTTSPTTTAATSSCRKAPNPRWKPC